MKIEIKQGTSGYWYIFANNKKSKKYFSSYKKAKKYRNYILEKIGKEDIFSVMEICIVEK